MRLFCGLPFEWWINPKEKLDLNKNEVVLIRPSSIGDVLFVTPIAKKIKQLNPKIKVRVMTRLGELLVNNPYIDSIENSSVEEISVLKCQKFFMAYEFNPERNAVKAYGRRLGLKISDIKPELFLTDKERLNRYWLSKKLGKFILIHAECDWKSRRWSLIYWQELIEKLRKYNLDIVNLTKKGSIAFSNIHNFWGIRNLRDVMAIIREAELLITIDSGIMNMGVALDKPVVSIFTITEPEKRLPEKWVKTAVCNEGISRGYHHRRKPVPVEFDISDKEYERCSPDFDDITPDKVMAKVKEILG
jgi:ADP-heptose:LPS heptosyltransferase